MIEYAKSNNKDNYSNTIHKEVKIIHKKRKYGETKIYTYKNLPKIAIRHLIGMLKIKFLNG